MTTLQPDEKQGSHDLTAFFYGAAGVVVFGLTLPATRLAVAELDPVFVGLGRGVVAAACAAVLLVITRTAPPARRHWPGLAVTAFGVVIGFPLFATLAMRSVPASHGGVVLAILPLATAVAGVVIAQERPSPAFWGWGLAGAIAVLAFTIMQTGAAILHGFRAADLYLFAAIACAAIGYAAGGPLSRSLGGWQVICWALIIGLPVVVALLLWLGRSPDRAASWIAWGGFLYVALFSQLIGFFAWNKGLAMGGVAKIGQLQLLQPFVTLLASYGLLGERIGWVEMGFALLVVGIVLMGRTARVDQIIPSR